MWTYLREIWRFALKRIDSPLYERELTGWSYISFFEKLQRSCLPLAMAMLIITMGLCSLPFMLAALDEAGSLAITPYAMLGGLYIAGEILLFLAGLIGMALASTAISSEIEAQSYALLRISPFSTRQIVLTKFGAAFYQVRLPLALNFFTRLGSVIGIASYSLGLLVGAVFVAVDNLPTPEPLPPPLTPTPPLPVIPVTAATDSVILVAVVIIALLFWILYYLLEPALRTAMFTAIGLLASAFSKTRTGGLIGSVALRGGYAAANYVFTQLLGVSFQLLFLPFALLSGGQTFIETLLTNRPTLAAVFIVGLTTFGIAFRLLMPLIVTVGTLALTEWRAAKLPYDIG